MKRRRPASYAWALTANEPHDLSDSARLGLAYARRLAEDARIRKDQLLHREPRLPALTIEDVADSSGVSAGSIRGCISAARRALYGDLTDSGIYYRQRRQRELRA